jgi:hypothetical protein
MTNHLQQRDDHDLSWMLSDDVLAEVLRRLAPRCLAASRCVCKAWHAVVDSRRLLRADLLPLSMDGIVIQFKRLVFAEIFSRPSTPTSPSIVNFEHLLTSDAWVQSTDHCNGLVLLKVYRRSPEYVVNPATGWAAPLPPCPSPCLATKGNYYDRYLVFDPTVSAHYEVFSVPSLYSKPEKAEWPPSTFIIRVFSSVSQRWEERSFSREGAPATDDGCYLDQPCAAYWRGSLYVLCQTSFSVMRYKSHHLIYPPERITRCSCHINIDQWFDFPEYHCQTINSK